MKKKRYFCMWPAAVCIVFLTAVHTVTLAAQEEFKLNAIYLGIENYGAPETNRENKDYFRYRFSLGGKEEVFFIDNGDRNEEGEYDYPIQNLLKEKYPYQITIREGTVIRCDPISRSKPDFSPVVSGTPGKRTLENFLKTALMPVGTTLYVYGGGWDWQDTGSSIQARTLGVSPDWVRFFEDHHQDYTYKSGDPYSSYYPYGKYNEYYYAGLDCSGYVGWVIYNTFETRDGAPGYVGYASGFSKKLADLGWGTWTHETGSLLKPGDIVSMSGHVWICLGSCQDGSIVIAHSTPSSSRSGQPGGGVQISALGWSRDCEAYRLADQYMSAFYPVWSGRYETILKDPGTYLTSDGEYTGLFTWDTGNGGSGLTDPEGIRELPADEVLSYLFTCSAPALPSEPPW